MNPNKKGAACGLAGLLRNMECYDMKKVCALLLGVLVFAGCSGCVFIFI